MQQIILSSICKGNKICTLDFMSSCMMCRQIGGSVLVVAKDC
jgi:hypothetical protein